MQIAPPIDFYDFYDKGSSMYQSPLQRRTVLVTAALAAVVPMRTAIAQMGTPQGADWFTMVQTHHALIAKTLDALNAAKSTGQRTAALNLLGYQLTAHSVAEENTIYPMLAMFGIGSADKLYLDQAHAKVINAQLDTWAALEQTGPDFDESASKLRTAVLQHAKQDEEADMYPQLRTKLSQAQNALLTSNYKIQFDSVRVIKAV